MSPSSAHDPVKAHLSYWKRVAPVDKLHVASPFFLSEPDDENEFITPAVEGTKRVVNAAMGAGVKRLVLTSSVADMELGVINPAAVLGTSLGANPDAQSIALMTDMITGKMPMYPDLTLGVVDVRDVARLHVKAMTAEGAAGKRFIASTAEPVAMGTIARYELY